MLIMAEHSPKSLSSVRTYYYHSVKQLLNMKGKPPLKKLLENTIGDVEQYMSFKLKLILYKSDPPRNIAELEAI